MSSPLWPPKNGHIKGFTSRVQVVVLVFLAHFIKPTLLITDITRKVQAEPEGTAKNYPDM